MRYLIVLIIASCLSSAIAEETPEATLDAYFKILTGRDYSGIENLIDSTSMANLKKTMDGAIRYQANHGIYTLQRRIFGRKVPLSEVDAATAEFYLNSLAGEILEAARTQHLVVDNREILGKIEEDLNTVHIVARLNMSQDDHHGSEILVYTLVRESNGWRLKFPATIKQMLTVIESTARQVR